MHREQREGEKQRPAPTSPTATVASVPYAAASACLPWRKRTTRITRKMSPLYVMVGGVGVILLRGVGVGVGEGVDVGVSLGVSVVVGVGIRH